MINIASVSLAQPLDTIADELGRSLLAQRDKFRISVRRKYSFYFAFHLGSSDLPSNYVKRELEWARLCCNWDWDCLRNKESNVP